MAKQITIELPDRIEINSAKDAPARLRTVLTCEWSAEFVLDLVEFGLGERLGNVWSVGKKSIEKMTAAHAQMERGEWQTRARTGATQAKFDEGIKKLNAAVLFNKLSPEQLSALAAMISADQK